MAGRNSDLPLTLTVGLCHRESNLLDRVRSPFRLRRVKIMSSQLIMYRYVTVPYLLFCGGHCSIVEVSVVPELQVQERYKDF